VVEERFIQKYFCIQIKPIMKKLFFYLLLFYASYHQVHARTYIFTGTYNSDWTNPLNWKSSLGIPGNVILKNNTVIIEGSCTISQGITVSNYGTVIVKQSCPSFDFHTINNYGQFLFEQKAFQQALGETFTNYPGARVVMEHKSIPQFNHFINEGLVQESCSLAIVHIQEWSRE
jgi:hypothetical protein